MDATGDWDEFDTAAALIAGAATAGELFGPRPSTTAASVPAPAGPAAGGRQIRAARDEYRRLARLCHPDRHAADRRPLAEATFSRLAALWRAWQAGPAPAPPARLLATGRHLWHLGRFLEAGDTVDRYAAVDANSARPAVVEIPRRLADCDLATRDAEVLGRFAAEVDGRWRPYFPTLIESVRHRDASGRDRRINVVEPLPGFVSLAAVRAAHPNGLDARDAAWMWRRLLVALGAAHRAGVVHGAALPDRVLIHPGDHGLVLREWGLATTAPGQPLPALAARYRDWYPPEVAARQPAGPATDLYLAARTLAWLLGDRPPGPLRRFVAGCLLPAPRMRPPDAWALLAEFDELIERLWGPRRFRPFHLPTT